MSRGDAGIVSLFALLITAVALTMASMIGQNVIELTEKSLPKESVAAYISKSGETLEIVNPSNLAADLSKLDIIVNGEKISVRDENGNDLWEPGERISINFSLASESVAVLEILYDGREVYKAIYMRAVPIHSDLAYPTITYSGTGNYHVSIRDDTAIAAVKVMAGTDSGETLVEGYTPFSNLSKVKGCFNDYIRHGRWTCSEFSTASLEISVTPGERGKRVNVRGNEFEGNVSYLRIVAYDISGKPSSLVLLSDSPPSVKIVQPGDGENFTTTDEANIHVVATARDDFGVSKLKIYLDGEEVRECNASRCEADVKAGEGEHSITATATDTTGQQGSDTVRITVTVDTPPSVEITNPEDGETFVTNDEAVSVAVSAIASDDKGVSEVEFYVDGAKVCSDPTEPYGCNLSLSPGNHEIKAVAIDTAGQQASDSVEVSVVKNDPPNVDLSAPSTVWTAASNFPVRLELSYSDDEMVEVAKVVEGEKELAKVYPREKSGSIELSVTLSEGIHELKAIVEDNRGAKGESDPVSVDVKKLSVSVTSPKESESFVTTSSEASVNFKASVTGNASKLEFLVDGSLIATLSSSPYETSANVSSGNHEVEARAYDSEGRYVSDSVGFSVIQDLPPKVSLSAPSSVSAHGPANVSVRLTASDDFGVKLVELYDGETLVKSWSAGSKRFSGEFNLSLNTGTHVLVARATDTAGSVNESKREVKVSFANSPPTISSPELVTAKVGKEISFAVSVSDPDGDEVTVTAENLPSKAVFSGLTFSWTPSNTGIYTVKFRATDEYGASSESKTTISVLPSGSVEIISIRTPEIDWSKEVRELSSVVLGG